MIIGAHMIDCWNFKKDDFSRGLPQSFEFLYSKQPKVFPNIGVFPPESSILGVKTPYFWKRPPNLRCSPVIPIASTQSFFFFVLFPATIWDLQNSVSVRVSFQHNV